MIEFNNVSKNYNKTKALDNVSLTIEQGKTVGLLGVNGSGKSTFIKLLAGIIKPDSGRILVKGKAIGKDTKTIISTLTEVNSFPNRMTVLEVIRFYKLMYKDFNETKFNQWIKDMQLEKHSKKKMKDLSKGMLQKLRLALTLSRDAKVFLLDEPLGGIDPLARDEIIEILASKIEPDITIIITTHLISEIENLIEKAIFIDVGRIIGDYDCEEIRINEGKSIEKLYKEVLRNERTN